MDAIGDPRRRFEHGEVLAAAGSVAEPDGQGVSSLENETRIEALFCGQSKRFRRDRTDVLDRASAGRAKLNREGLPEVREALEHGGELLEGNVPDDERLLGVGTARLDAEVE